MNDEARSTGSVCLVFGRGAVEDPCGVLDGEEAAGWDHWAR